MYENFIKEIDSLILKFKETGDIDSMIKLEKIISRFLDSTVMDYLDEDTSTTYSSKIDWVQNRT